MLRFAAWLGAAVAAGIGTDRAAGQRITGPTAAPPHSLVTLGIDTTPHTPDGPITPMVAGTVGDGWEWDLLLLTVLDGEVGIVETIRAAGDGWPRWVFTGPPGVYTARLIARQPGRRVESVHRVTIGDAPPPGPQPHPQPPGPQPEPEPEPTPAGWSAWIEANRPKDRPEWATEAKAAAKAFRAAADAGTWSTGRELAEQTAAQLATALGPAAFLAWAGFRRALSGRLAGLELTTVEQHRAAWQEIAAALERGA